MDEPEQDEQLLQRLASGEATAIDALYDHHAQAVFALLVRIVVDRQIAEDLLQEVYVRAWRHAATYRRERGRVRPWLFGIAHHLALNELRRQRRRPRIEHPPEGTAERDWGSAAFLDHGPAPDEIVWATLRQTEAVRALQRLPEPQRAVIELYVSGYSQGEIAQRISEPLGTVKSRLRRGLQLLRQMLEAEGLSDE